MQRETDLVVLVTSEAQQMKKWKVKVKVKRIMVKEELECT